MNNNSSPLIGSTLITTGAWTHLAFVYDAALRQQQIYVNGRIDAVSYGLVSPYQGGTSGAIATIGRSASATSTWSYYTGWETSAQKIFTYMSLLDASTMWSSLRVVHDLPVKFSTMPRSSATFLSTPSAPSMITVPHSPTVSQAEQQSSPLVASDKPSPFHWRQATSKQRVSRRCAPTVRPSRWRCGSILVWQPMVDHWCMCLSVRTVLVTVTIS